MALILRKVSRGKWLPGAGDGTRPDDEVAAEDFQDLDNQVSVWGIEADQSNLNRVIAAIAATRDWLTPIAYVLFDSALATDLGINIVHQDGDTPDHHANITWHRDLSNPLPDQILALVAAIRALRPDDPPFRIRDADVLTHLKQSVENGWINPDALSEQLRRKVTS